MHLSPYHTLILLVALCRGALRGLAETSTEPLCAEPSAGASLIQHQAQRAVRQVSSLKNKVSYATAFIPNPAFQKLDELKRTPIDKTGMLNSTEKGPTGPVQIFTYSTEEDVFVSGVINGGGTWEGGFIERVYDAWKTLGSRKGNFLDVGANIGTWSLPMAQAMKGTNSKVISVEATPPILEHLRAGIVANEADNLILFPYAVGEPAKEHDSVQMALNPTNKGGSTVVGNKEWSTGSVEKFSVGLTTLDSLLNVNGPDMRNVFYAKFDIEGNEPRAIAGGQKFFSEYPPCVLFMEVNARFLASTGTTVAAVESTLEEFGYDIAGYQQFGDTNAEFKQKDFAKCVSRLQ
jgi:FkbM family methyltransferase